jgi:hypothetical protein
MDSKLFLGTKVTRPEDVRYSVNEGMLMRFSRDRKLRGDTSTTSRIGISESATSLGFVVVRARRGHIAGRPVPADSRPR